MSTSAHSVQAWNSRLSGCLRPCGCALRGAMVRANALQRPLVIAVGPTRGLTTTAGNGAAPVAQGLSMVGRTVLFVPACITMCLGAWQLDRLEWKYDQIELRQQLLASKPRLVSSSRELLECWDELMPQHGGIEFAPITLRGRFEHEKEVYIGMRGKPGAVEEGLGAGYSVITPFVIEGPNEKFDAVRVLVNRGWVPPHAKKQRSEKREQAESAGSRTGVVPSAIEDLEVVVRKGEKGAS